MDHAAKILRWLAVLPVFLLTAVTAGSLIIFFLYVVASLALVKWFLPDAQQYLAFWRGSGMSGNFLDGTAWLFMTYAVAFGTAVTFAARIAPAHQLPTAWVLSALSLLVLFVSFVLTLFQPESQSFSFWYRSLVEALSIAVGCAFGIWQLHSDTRPASSSTNMPSAFQ